MDIKYSIYFFVDKESVRDGDEVYVSPEGVNYRASGKVRMRVRWEGRHVAAFNVGHRVELKNWCADAQRCKRATLHGRSGTPSFLINNRIQRMEEMAHEVFARCGAKGCVPTGDEFRSQFNKLAGRERKVEEEGRRGFFDVLDEFTAECGVMNAWSPATHRKFAVLKAHLTAFDAGLTFDALDERKLVGLVEYFLHTGMRNSTLKRELGFLRWFLGWAYDKGYTNRLDWKRFRPNITTVPRKVVFLSWEELMRLYNWQPPAVGGLMDRARDLFCLQCFTSLRYSDVCSLKRSNVKEDRLEIVTKKTADPLTIDLNKYSRAILEKYRHACFDDDRALPDISAQKMNLLLKAICREVGLDEPVNIVWYVGSERRETTSPKWELVSTHCGRRTFICNSLTMGIPAETVMRWTGHSNYNAMKPYIAIADRERRAAMQKWDSYEFV